VGEIRPRRLHELPPFNRRTMEAVRLSCARLPEPLELTREFYRDLFKRVPATRTMFPADMTAQHERLLGGILAAVQALDRPHVVEESLRRWGVVHRRTHGITDDLYPHVGHSLIHALKLLSPDMENSVGSAWVAVYEWMAAVMIDGADRADLADENTVSLVGRDEIHRHPTSAVVGAEDEMTGSRSPDDVGVDLDFLVEHTGPTRHGHSPRR
jgi:hemoglobin-like flavoprotein